METSTLGLRDRKRLQTRMRLEEAAVALVLRDGLEQTTVDAISEAADVSPRTFFNYFDSKDLAILGLRHTDVDDQALTAQLRDDVRDDMVATVVHLMLSVLGAPYSTPALREGRLEVLRRHPQLLADQLIRVSELTGRLSIALSSHLSTDTRFADLDPEDRGTQAELLLGTCGTAVRLALRAPAVTDETYTSDLEQRAVSLVHDLMGRVTWTR